MQSSTKALTRGLYQSFYKYWFGPRATLSTCNDLTFYCRLDLIHFSAFTDHLPNLTYKGNLFACAHKLNWSTSVLPHHLETHLQCTYRNNTGVTDCTIIDLQKLQHHIHGNCPNPNTMLSLCYNALPPTFTSRLLSGYNSSLLPYRFPRTAHKRRRIMWQKINKDLPENSVLSQKMSSIHPVIDPSTGYKILAVDPLNILLSFRSLSHQINLTPTMCNLSKLIATWVELRLTKVDLEVWAAYQSLSNSFYTSNRK